MGEEELDQMVRDFIESETPTSNISLLRASKPLSLNHQPILQEVLGKHTHEEAEIHGKILMYVKDMGTAGHQTDNLKKLVVMRLRNDGYEASLCKTSWLCTSSHPKGGYEYIDVMVMENCRTKRVIVDMEFRSQFELARPTLSYKEMINNLPLMFVGTEEKLNWIIPLLCSAVKKSLKEKGLHIPPWRKPAYMQSKWLSKNCKKVSVSPQDIDVLEDHHHHKTQEKSSTGAATTTCFPSIFSRSQLNFCLKP
ncbi:hypothetical protein PTKIN_Ptkin09bG0166200 [Pterospermum kingtungense]